MIHLVQTAREPQITSEPLGLKGHVTNKFVGVVNHFWLISHLMISYGYIGTKQCAYQEQPRHTMAISGCFFQWEKRPATDKALIEEGQRGRGGLLLSCQRDNPLAMP